ncbi:SemiSWEET family sugar transporter [Vacuolonema iberomarrocanum]|uniref:SemiSWEET family sugar transporter n=1 Tax=Vacuolonema iberomarrocanum TaxID=3454632 RepID=UPI0019EA8CD3|nr:SemiSWEET transporter [filamentous cyanobacterium LEGE 07170]
MDWSTLLGLLAGSLTTASFVPQVLKTWRSRSARDISALWLITFITGISLWLIYGLLILSLPIILANGITLALTLLILFFKLQFRG